ncbi:hypothetical protein ACOBQJ_03525 [Pelotomaculum propionicicum]|uniref:hypothetical protein n=1 Tax=Pelotomaculum propionicicum TaxID=258475 RepID=UPI003B7B85FC
MSVTFLADQLADNWGRFVKVFGKGETVKGSAIVDGDTIYCITARHELLDYSDFISLERIEVKMN